MEGKREIQNIYPLTPMQEGMLYHSLVNKGSHAYYEQVSFDMHHPVNISLLEKSINTVIAKLKP